MSCSLSADLFREVFSDQFPQLQPPKYEVIRVINKDETVYRAKIHLFDQAIFTGKDYPTEVEAVNHVIELAKEVIREFTSIYNSDQPAPVKQVISSVEASMKTFTSSDTLPAEYPKVEAVDGLQIGNDPVNIIRLSENDLEGADNEAEEQYEPVSFLGKIASQTGSSPPNFLITEKLKRFGCQLTCSTGSGVATVSVDAQFKTKADAKKAAAKLLCEKMYPNRKFSGPTIQSIKQIKQAECEIAKPEVVSSQSDTNASADISAKNAVSELNILCQKNGVPLPEFNFDESDKVKGLFVCKVSEFGITVKSGSYLKKSQAKEEAASLMCAQLTEMYVQKAVKIPGRSVVAMSNLATSSISSSVSVSSENSASKDVVMDDTSSVKSVSQTISQSEFPNVTMQSHQNHPPQFPNMHMPMHPMMHAIYPNPYMAMQMLPNPYMNMMGMYGGVPGLSHNIPPPLGGAPTNSQQPFQMSNQYQSYQFNQQQQFPGIFHGNNQQSPILPPGSMLMMPNQQQPQRQPMPFVNPMMMPFAPHPHHGVYGSSHMNNNWMQMPPSGMNEHDPNRNANYPMANPNANPNNSVNNNNNSDKNT
jgi:hypothetical protein